MRAIAEKCSKQVWQLVKIFSIYNGPPFISTEARGCDSALMCLRFALVKWKTLSI